MKSFCLILLATASMAHATTLYTANDSDTRSASAGSNSSVTNCLGSTAICSSSLNPGSGSVAGLLQLALPTILATANSAMLNLTSLVDSSNVSGNVTSVSPVGGYSCGFFQTCFNNSPANLVPGPQNIFHSITQISSSSFTWTGSMGLGLVDLLTLGFSSGDLLNGGLLNITYSMNPTIFAPNITSNGFNAVTQYTQSYNVTATQSADLTINGDVPEPATTALIGAGLLLLGFTRLRRSA